MNLLTEVDVLAVLRKVRDQCGQALDAQTLEELDHAIETETNKSGASELLDLLGRIVSIVSSCKAFFD